MQEIVKVLPNFKKFNSYIKNVKEGLNPIMLSGLTDVARVHFAYSTFFYVEKPIIIITYNEMSAKKIIRDLEYFANKIEYFPKREILAYDYLAESKDIEHKRIECLNNIYNKKAKIIVTTIEAVSQKIISKQSLYKNIINIKKGETVELEKLKGNLMILGYERADITEANSEYSVRGGIVDIGISEHKGLRIELWGDVVDSIRYFDLNTQRSITGEHKTTSIYPTTEFVLEDTLENIANKITGEDSDLIRNGEYLNKVDKYFNKFYEKQETLLDYIQNEYIIFLDEVSRLKSRLESILKDNTNLVKSLMEKERIVPEALTNLTDYIEFMNNIKRIQTIYLEKHDIGFVDKQSMHAKRNGYSFSYREVNFFRSSVDICLQEVQKAIKENKTVIVLTGNIENTKKTLKLFDEKNIDTKKIIIDQNSLSGGFECYDFNLLVISTEEIFKIHKKRTHTSQEFKQGETVIFSDLKIGDYVVHKTNGIGQFIGVNTIKADGIIKDYIKIRYKNDDILYIPTNNLDSIRKYIGAGNRAPKINRLRK